MMQEKCAEIGVGEIASLCGRYYAMDRDKRWDRVEKAYRAIVSSAGEHAEDPLQAVQAAYAREQTEEFVAATARGGYSGQPCVHGLLLGNFCADTIRDTG